MAETSPRRAHGPSLEQAPLGSRPTALILSGGAALGSWQGGVLHELCARRGWSLHSVLGTSAGSVNAAAYYQDGLEALREAWRDVPRRSFLRPRPRLFPPSLFAQAPVRAFLARFIDEERARARGRCWLYVVSADIRDGGLFQASFSPAAGGGRWDGPLVDCVLGSVAVPYLFPPVELAAGAAGPRARLLVDGHLLSFADLRPLASRGARDFVFVTVVGRHAPRVPRLSPRGFTSALVGELLRAQVHNALAALDGPGEEHGLRFFELDPLEPLKMGVFAFDREECRRSFDQGTRDAQEFLSRPADFRIE
ncbi:MAG: patatin-like phospholipase family protein [Elusimicrobiota bacterium]|jgi:predicted acylesterase/phospholipase RssA